MNQTPEIELTGGFDYSGITPASSDRIQAGLERIRELYQQSVYTALETGRQLLKIKAELVDDRAYRRWIDSELRWGKSTAYQFENVAKKFGNVQNLDKFDVSALYVLAAPSTPDAIREQAIALAESGQRVSHNRAKLLKSGSDVLTLQAEQQVLVQSGPYQGQTVTIKATEREGFVSVDSPKGKLVLLASELLAEPQSDEPVTLQKRKPQQSNQIEAIASSLEIESERVGLLESILGRICIAARLAQLTDDLLKEAESFLR